MVKNNEYDLLEYCDMAGRLGYDEVIRENGDQIYNRLLMMRPSEIKTYPNLISILNTKMSFNIEKSLPNVKAASEAEIYYDPEDEQIHIIVYVSLRKSRIDINNLGDKYPFDFVNSRTIFIPIYELKDKPIIEQYQDILDSIKEFDDTVYNNPLEKKEVSVK